MELFCLSLNHRVTPLDVRERVALGPEETPPFLDALLQTCGAKEALVLSTCNRTELYTCVPRVTPIDTVAEQFGLLAGRDFHASCIPPNYVLARDASAVRHLLRVASGLESQILGESEILGQVKTAGEMARAAGADGRVLHRLWERALHTGKRVRSETTLGDGALSVSYAALELARRIFGSLEGRHVLIVGTGEVGLLAIQNLEGAGLSQLTLVNRTRARAEEVAALHGGVVRDFTELPEAIADADIVISSTGASEPIVSLDQMKSIRQQRGGGIRPLLIVDVAMPRDFDPRCAGLDEIFLKNLDDLREIVEQNAELRRAALPLADAIVEEECEGFLHWLHSLDIEPTIRGFRERAEELRQEELENLRGSVDDETFAAMDRLTRRLLNRVLHLPSENLRRHRGLRDADIKKLVHELFTEEVPHPKAADEVSPNTDELSRKEGA